MTRSNLHIKLSNGKSLVCVADSSSAPEQGYIVERLFLPLLSLDNSEQELEMLKEHCTIDERRINADYRYLIDLAIKEFFHILPRFCTNSFEFFTTFSNHHGFMAITIHDHSGMDAA